MMDLFVVELQANLRIRRRRQRRNRIPRVDTTTITLPLKPNKTSGLRIGFAAVTTRGCTKKDAEDIGELIYRYLKNEISDQEAKEQVSKLVKHWKPIEQI